MRQPQARQRLQIVLQQAGHPSVVIVGGAGWARSTLLAQLIPLCPMKSPLPAPALPAPAWSVANSTN